MPHLRMLKRALKDADRAFDSRVDERYGEIRVSEKGRFIGD